MKFDDRSFWLLAGSGLALVASFFLFAVHALPALSFGHSLNYGEGILLDQVRRIQESDGLYPSFESAPYVIDNYPPVYPWLASLIPSPEVSPFFAGRFLSVLSTIVSATMVALLVRRVAGDAAGLLSAAIFFLVPEVNRFAVLMRVDSMGLAWGLVGLYSILGPTRGWRLVGCIAFFLSVYTRHSMLAFPLAGAALLAARDGRRALPWVGGLTAAGIVAFLTGDFLLSGRLHEHLINFNVLAYRWASIHEKGLLTQWPGGMLLVVAVFWALRPAAAKPRFQRLGHVVGCAAACLWFGHFTLDSLQTVPRGGHRSVGARLHAGAQKAGERARVEEKIALDEVDLARVLAEPSTVKNAATIRKLRAEIHRREQQIENYPRVRDVYWIHGLLGAVALSALYAGLSSRRLRKKVERNHEDPTLAQGLFVLLGSASVLLIGRSGSDVNYLLEYFSLMIVTAGFGLGKGSARERGFIVLLLVAYALGPGWHGFRHRDTRADVLNEKASASEKILERLRGVDGPILSETPAFPALLRRPVSYQPFMYRTLFDSGKWDPGGLVREIEERKFSAVIREGAIPSAGYEDGERYFAGSVWIRQRTFPPAVDQALEANYERDPSTRSIEKVTDDYYRGWVIWFPKERGN